MTSLVELGTVQYHVHDQASGLYEREYSHVFAGRVAPEALVTGHRRKLIRYMPYAPTRRPPLDCNSHRVNHRYLIVGKPPVRGHDCEALDRGLSDYQAVERVPMVHRHPTDLEPVNCSQGERAHASRCDLLLEVVRDLKFAHGDLDADFGVRDHAQQKVVRSLYRLGRSVRERALS